ncbi:hypothetical protein B0H16DRAFT_1881359 [Mycena metata]|uniref:Uncharacterized protein n=1 Tax=Mycena metata TaxID=1033252 RepID=A0AAD7JWI6_9AGAR|nr:hypothetical protein B0H16DRAFT_1881359 [Mycena metata]
MGHFARRTARRRRQKCRSPYTLGVVGGATPANDKYPMRGEPFLAGVSVVALSTLAPLVLPITAVRALAEAIYLYAGLAVFGGFVLFSNFRPNVLQTLRKQRQALSLSKLEFPRYSTDVPIIEATRPIQWRRGVAATVMVLEGALNRETREGLSAAERSLLNSSFAYTRGSSLVSVSRVVSAPCSACSTLPGAHRPETLLLVGRHALSSLLPQPRHPPPRGLYTLGVVGGLSYVGATPANDKYLMLGGLLLAGVSVVALSTLAPLILPVTAVRVRALAVTEAVYLYAGLAVFGGFVLYDTQKIL